MGSDRGMVETGAHQQSGQGLVLLGGGPSGGAGGAHTPGASKYSCSTAANQHSRQHRSRVLTPLPRRPPGLCPFPVLQQFLFLKQKCRSLFLQRKRPAKLAWTVLYRKQHRKVCTACTALHRPLPRCSWECRFSRCTLAGSPARWPASTQQQRLELAARQPSQPVASAAGWRLG